MSAEQTVKYVVRKRFKYQGEFLMPGDEFVPTGGKWDATIIARGELVGRVESALPQVQARTEARRARKERK